MSFMDAISVGIDVITGVAGYVSSSNQADANDEASEQRAKDLKELSARDYEHNSKAMIQNYGTNLGNLYIENARSGYKSTIGLINAKSQVLSATAQSHSNGVLSSSFRSDALSRLDAEFNMQVGQQLADLEHNSNQLQIGVNTGLEQLAINRDKMEKDISYNLDSAGAQNDALRMNGVVGALGSFGNAYSTYKKWG